MMTKVRSFPVHIQDVEFASLRVEKGFCEAVVTLLTDKGATHCACRIAASVGQSLSALQRSLLQDALRQLRRMPEYRRNLADITLSTHLIESETPLAA